MSEKIYEGSLADLMACCETMRQQLLWKCDQHTSPFDCPDALVIHDNMLGYILPVHDGGKSGVMIAFCPFCGEKLPPPAHEAGTRAIPVD